MSLARHAARLLPALTALLLLPLLVLPSAARADFDEDHKEVINGTTLHFRVRGADKTNPYLVILHGGPGFSSHMFLPWGKTSGIEQKLNVVYLDQRGSGESERLKIAALLHPKPEEVKDYTIPTLIADIEGVRKALKVEKWYVLGHSWGGMLGVEYVAAHPESVRGYIHMDGLLSQPAAQLAILNYVDTFYGRKGVKAEIAKAKRAEVARLRKLPAGDTRQSGAFTLLFFDRALFLSAYYADPARATTYQTSVGSAVKNYGVPASALMAAEPSAALASTEHYATRDVTPLLAKLRGIPVLILNGQQDHVIPPTEAQRANKAIPGSRLVLLEDCGHFPFAEQSEKTTRAIVEFSTRYYSTP